jgi:hypothetical protein
MKLGTLLVVVVALGTALAANAQNKANPMSEGEAAKLAHYALEPRLVACMAEYKFDFFSNQLGLSIDGGQRSELDQLQQFRLFLTTGKLEQVDPKAKIEKGFAKHCAIVAQTVAEMIALNLAGRQAQEPKAESQSN